MKNIAIIPARSGSKGLQDKNIKELCGKPLIAYTIEAALKSGRFDEVMVSTDSEKYAQIAREYGANVPFLRSSTNASDSASTADVIYEVLDRYEDMGQSFDTLCILQPTSPLRDAEDIIGAYQEYEDMDAVAVVSVCECEHSPRWSNVLPEDRSLNGFILKDGVTRRQGMNTYYRLNGAVYVADVEEYRRDSFFYRQGAYAYVMDADKSVDIDNLLDLRLAETIMRYGEEN